MNIIFSLGCISEPVKLSPFCLCLLRLLKTELNRCLQIIFGGTCVKSSHTVIGSNNYRLHNIIRATSNCYINHFIFENVMTWRLFDINRTYVLSYRPTVLCIRCISLIVGLSRFFWHLLFLHGLGGQYPYSLADVTLASLNKQKHIWDNCLLLNYELIMPYVTLVLCFTTTSRFLSPVPMISFSYLQTRVCLLLEFTYIQGTLENMQILNAGDLSELVNQHLVLKTTSKHFAFHFLIIPQAY